MMVIGHKIKSMEKACMSTLIKSPMMDIGFKIKKMAKAFLFT